ncbi:hypothetical protein STSP2_02855 [Anaerohalosphaera lusitana]|uniref:Uncharacterized protein n=1 Tax=Anaerohalosphaera lusitana TaxID=1936003 RepID=A0A1U9NI58_9BACT|nr:transposase [Anaerohalosphaera lusitana]AQT67428.1 hypothetical protein STSP2_00575 [Anaerohalosphaera lusitana]AQT68290.1 hypothetical protein STSP2_01448 [Anaerohalosphaera lusitana]AQT69297.1 hypothetical protein STSP2_02486 [Anaerohalosphaera lusitana]AQT69476.1 hypothetical protein STSP2_02667 [Anaerohalosphaera lusitana]AQT69661.1 hypothetical protein STSP2_02855 [Anaerohalosphaera lusitana]
MRHKGSKSYEFITKRGNISLTGTYYHCSCGSSKPISNLVSSGRKYSRIANELVLRHTASGPYKEVSRFLRQDFSIHISHESLRRRILAVSGSIRQNRDCSSDDRKWDEIAGSKLYGYADGVLINVRREGWKEVKLLRYEDDACSKVSHRAVLGPIKQFGSLARREAIRIGASKAKDMTFLMDGAEGFHRHIKSNLPNAKQVVDYWHCCQHIGECASLLYGENSKRSNRWRSKYCHVLRDKGPKKLIRSLRISKSRVASSEDAEALSKLINFLSRRIERIDYPKLLAMGLRVDSGPIESSCKTVVQARLKSSGMRWSRQGASAMLEVRTALHSDLWEYAIKDCA